MEWMLMPLKRYAEFSGRSRRKEYWMYVLFLIIVSVVISVIESAGGLTGMAGPYGPLTALFSLGTIVPNLAVSVRRLHDTNRSGWWLLLGLVPYLLALALMFMGQFMLGGIMVFVAIACGVAVLVFMCLEGTKGPNNYGPDPKGSEGAATVAA